MRRPAFALGALLLALATLPRAGTAADAPYEINAILPQTGGASLMGAAFGATLNVISDLVNKSGGIRGRPIKFVVWDGQSNPKVIVQIFSTLIAKGVPLVIGPNQTGECRAALPLLQNGPVMYCISPQLFAPSGSYAFAAGVTTRTSLEVLMHYFHARGWTKLGVIVSTDATGVDAEKEIDAAQGTEKLETIVDREHFSPGDISVAAQMAHLGGSGAQLILAWSTGAAFATLVRGTHDAGLDVPLASSNANLIYSQLESLRPFLPKDLFFIGIPSSANVGQLPRGALKGAVESYLGAFRAAGIRPEDGQYQLWDEVWICIDALKKLGLGATAPQVRDYISNLHGWTGVHGTYDFRAFPGRGLGSSSLAVVRWDPATEGWVNVSTDGGTPLK